MRVGVLTGGGDDCPGLDAVIRAVVRKGEVEHGYSFVGFRDDWRGLTENLTRPLDVEQCRGILPRGWDHPGNVAHQPVQDRGRRRGGASDAEGARHRRSRRDRGRRHPRRRVQTLAGGRAGRRVPKVPPGLTRPGAEPRAGSAAQRLASQIRACAQRSVVRRRGARSGADGRFFVRPECRPANQ
jgi:hypothetical protein